MPTTVQLDSDTTLDLARAYVYRFLSTALADPVTLRFSDALDRRIQKVAVQAAQLLTSEAPKNFELGPGEHPPRQLDLLPVIDALARPLEAIIEEHRKLFGLLIGKAAPLCETEYCRSKLTFYRAQQLADVAGFYRAFKLEPNREEPERPDHISVELEFMAHLIQKELVAAEDRSLLEKAQVCREAQKKFLTAHLSWWVPAFAALVGGEPSDFYAALAKALACFIPCERAQLGVDTPRDLPEPHSEPEPAEENQCCGAMPCG